jgi:hypothetical protein
MKHETEYKAYGNMKHDIKKHGSMKHGTWAYESMET